ARSTTCPDDPRSIESFSFVACILKCLLPNLVLHAIQVYLVPSALDLSTRSRVHGASDKQDCRLDHWRLYHVVAASFHRSPCRGSERVEEIVNALGDPCPIFSNCHFLFTNDENVVPPDYV